MSGLSLRRLRSAPGRLRALSAVLVLSIVIEAAVRLGASGLASEVVFTADFLVGVLTMAPAVFGVLYVTHWLEHGRIEPDRHPRVWWWVVAGAVGSILLNVVLMTVLPVDSLMQVVAWLRWSAGMGAGVGAAIGVTEARAIQQAAEVERSTVRAEHLEIQRDLLDYLNSLLRHEVLNASNVISGYAELLQDEHEEGTSGYEYSRTIHRKSEEVTGVVQDVRVLLHATEERTNFERVDVAAVVREEVAKLPDLDEDVVVETDLPDSAFVYADALLPRVFGNLLANAVEHNDSDPPRVWVRGSVGTETVTVEIEDDGPGVDSETAEQLFERPSRRAADHGLGLYLVARLVEHYCGTVDLLETGADGSTFRVVLPRERPAETTASPFVGRADEGDSDGLAATDGAGQ
ncbi:MULTISPECIES: sensor histidine kinase KdpD [Halobacterium]|uniref:sensor histidine kinase n=1 Tax=Halobacterium TaxID=2239 RepID=UPI00073E6A22|nr:MULTISPECIES: HAMP domain-containing sensor histidine kinase [Halobacterium]MCG1003048.1 HAMP domain-containing histidine kinase [Halobacterium noricense]